MIKFTYELELVISTISYIKKIDPTFEDEWYRLGNDRFAEVCKSKYNIIVDWDSKSIMMDEYDELMFRLSIEVFSMEDFQLYAPYVPVSTVKSIDQIFLNENTI